MVSEEPAAARPRVRRTSEVLRAAVLAEPGERISVEQLDRALGRRAYGALMLLFALPNLVPVMPPGVSSVLSLPLLLLSVQLAAGRVAPWLPGWLRRRSLRRADLLRALEHADPWLTRIERLLRPRLVLVTSRTGERLIGLLCVVMSLVLFFPIPLGNWLPALAISVLSLALVERDGIAGLLGVAVALVALALAGSVVLAMVGAVGWLLPGGT